MTGSKIEILYQNRNGEYLVSQEQPLLKNGGTVSDHASTRYIHVDPNANDKPLPELYEKKELCCGCTACMTVCPRTKPDSNTWMEYQFLKSGTVEEYRYTNAISMFPDQEGFLYPVVDAQLCIRCYQCVNVCPFKTVDTRK